jgi:DnaJ-class molecular chaperone
MGSINDILYDGADCDGCKKPVADCICYQCPTCHGRGLVNPLTAPKGFFCVSTTECPTCDGSGEI